MSRLLLVLAVLSLGIMGTMGKAAICSDIEFEGQSFSICEIDARSENLRLFLRDDDGDILGSFRALRAMQPDETLIFAMNAGMYHKDRAPVGQYVENFVEEMRVVPNAGPGNFGLLPNGILCLTDTTAQVIETLAYLAQAPTCRDATQSGPMLVIDGELHPRLIPDGSSRFIRNGVGTSADGKRVVFAISNQAVNFHTFGRLFRDRLNLPNALFFDGKVSRLYSSELGRNDFGRRMGPMIAVFE